jgi:hypothetical protein
MRGPTLGPVMVPEEKKDVDLHNNLFVKASPRESSKIV